MKTWGTAMALALALVGCSSAPACDEMDGPANGGGACVVASAFPIVDGVYYQAVCGAGATLTCVCRGGAEGCTESVQGHTGFPVCDADGFASCADGSAPYCLAVECTNE